MKQTVKLILKYLLIILFVIGGILLVITILFADDIEKNIKAKIEKNIEAPLILDDIEFTIYENFPSASVKITNLLVMGSQEFNNDTLLFTKRAYIEIGLLDIIIKKRYDLNSIIITEGEINIEYNNLNVPNFLIFKKNADDSTSISVNKIALLNTQLNIKKAPEKLDINWLLNKAIVSINNDNYNFNIDGFSNKLAVDSLDYMKAKNFNFDAKTQIKKDTVSILTSNLNIEDVLFNIQGSIFNGNTLGLIINAKDQKINQIITHLPENIQKNCSPFIATGKITLHSSLKGLINKENNPLFEMKYEVVEGNFKLKSMPFELDSVQMNGHLSNGKGRNFNSTKIVSDVFKAKTKNGNINGKFTLSNLNNYFLDSQFKSSWDLTEVNQYFEDSPFMGLTGRVLSSTDYKGNISFDHHFKRKFLSSSHKSDLKIENVKFHYKIFPLQFAFKSMDCKINNHKVLVNSCQATISETDIEFNGEMLNFIAYILEEAPKIYVEGNAKSIYTNFSELMTLGDISKEDGKEESKNIMPNWIDANTIIDIENFSYENFIASNLSGVVYYKNGEITSESLNANTLNGEIAGKFTLTETISNNLKLIANITLKKINIRNSFEAFNNYGQTFIMKEQLKGVGDAELNIESYWKPNLVLDKEKLKINSHLIIEKGEVIDFKPLENLSSYVSLDELKHVKFSTLENTIDVANQVITIPAMEIKSSALSVFLSGTHTFNQEIDYDITLLLSELLSSSFRKENTKITEFGEEQQDGKIFNTVYFKMTGNTDDPKISLNKIRFMEDVNNSIKKEKETITNIIKEDILQTEEKQQEEQGQEIEIEWNPEL